MRWGAVPVALGFGFGFVHGSEHDRAGRHVGIDAPGGACPFEDAVGFLCDAPRGGVFERVVSAAQVREVAEGGCAAVGVVDGVVDVAAVDGLSASGESAVHVSHPEGALQLLGGRVSVDREHRARDRVRQDAVPSGAAAGEFAGRARVDRSDTRKCAGGITAADQGQR